jgi:hypothetical protein
MRPVQLLLAAMMPLLPLACLRPSRAHSPPPRLVEDIMVFGAAPCSAGRKKCRNVAYLGLLPVPVGGESDITEMYVERYGEPKPGERVFIRTRRQRNGWEGYNKDTSEVVPAEVVVEAVQIRSPKAEIRRPNRAGWGCIAPGMHKGAIPGHRRSCTGAVPSGQGGPRRLWKVGPVGRLCALAEARRSGHWRELWHGG